MYINIFNISSIYITGVCLRIFYLYLINYPLRTDFEIIT